MHGKRKFEVTFFGPPISLASAIQRLRCFGKVRVIYEYRDWRGFTTRTTLLDKHRLIVELPDNLPEIYGDPNFDYQRKVQSHALLVVQVALGKKIFEWKEKRPAVREITGDEA
jgi:hypothetical protein